MRRTVLLLRAILFAFFVVSSPSLAGDPKGVFFIPMIGSEHRAAPISHQEAVQLEVQRSAYKGSTYRLHPNIDKKFVDARVSRSILDSLTKADFIPGDRTGHFSWSGGANVAITGWSGRVTRITPTEDGWNIQVIVTPELFRLGSMSVSTADAYTEDYFFNRQGEFFFLGGRPTPSALKGSVFEL